MGTIHYSVHTCSVYVFFRKITNAAIFLNLKRQCIFYNMDNNYRSTVRRKYKQSCVLIEVSPGNLDLYLFNFKGKLDFKLSWLLFPFHFDSLGVKSVISQSVLISYFDFVLMLVFYIDYCCCIFIFSSYIISYLMFNTLVSAGCF